MSRQPARNDHTDDASQASASRQAKEPGNVLTHGRVALALRVYRQRQGEAAEKAAKQLFAFSILYLFLLLAVIVAEHGLGLASFAA